ncbi:uncharacterized protein SAPINGB_P001154 [Magnusiomyces paraingens]|uniref:tRNA-dihydrouridine(20a/20b) synthase [NAD(P)+] n=1 Tax=Magnusiomyces paraingens TaxID=2606893 RepID=A0A5E8B4B2_9ASCO|nr:uncharacterized protein SAPINGB_P001154 [Saprochaete ingens]VVT46318.1 unnamed protein product [Saprochaete ingens]
MTDRPQNLTLTEVILPPEHLKIASRNPENHPVSVIQRIAAQPYLDPASTTTSRRRPAFICGPMVRYSKLPFREIVRHHNADIVYTPMILAREFVRHPFARDSDFSTNAADAPVIAQFGANNPKDLVRAVQLIRPYVDGIGLNCGCPIKDQVREGIGAALMTKPDLVAEMVAAVKAEFGPGFCVEVKIRIHKDLKDTVAMACKAEAAGADFITVHGRQKTTRSSQPADFEAIKLVKQSVSVPVVANGDAFSVEDALYIADVTGCDGVMAVRGILANPAMFDLASYKRRTLWYQQPQNKDLRKPARRLSQSNITKFPFGRHTNDPQGSQTQLSQKQLVLNAVIPTESQLLVDGLPVLSTDLKNVTPWATVERFWDLVTAYGLPFRVAQHHFSEMLEGSVTKRQKKIMNDTHNMAELLAWFDSRLDLRRPKEPGFGEHREFPWREEFLERESQEIIEEEGKEEEEEKAEKKKITELAEDLEKLAVA